jgi:hypothetical protein
VVIPGLRVAQYITDEVYEMLDLAVVVRLPSFNYNCCTNHIACSRYVKLHDFVGLEGHDGGWASQVPFSSNTTCASLVHWNLSYFLRSLKKGRPLMSSLEMNLLSAAMHPVNF